MNKAPPPSTPAPNLKVPTVQDSFHQFLYSSHGPTMDKYIASAEEQTGLKRESLFAIMLAVVSLYLVFGNLAHTVCNLIGFVYPSYISVKAIRSDEKNDDTKWLIYWTVFGFFSLIDSFAEDILSFFPVYYLFKALFLVYLYLPQTDGAQVLYTNYVDPAVTAFDRWYYEEEKNESKRE